MKKIIMLPMILLCGACSSNKESRALQAARAELLAGQWQREAVYGVKDDEHDTPRIRRVYVPGRFQNGVQIQGGMQEVWVR